MPIGFSKIGLDIRDELGGATVASGVKSTVILGPFNLMTRPTKSFMVHNQGTFTLSGAEVQINPDPGGDEVGLQKGTPGTARRDPDANLWYRYGSMDNIAAGGMAALVANDLFRWWRVVGSIDDSAGRTLPVSGYVLASTV